MPSKIPKYQASRTVPGMTMGVTKRVSGATRNDARPDPYNHARLTPGTGLIAFGGETLGFQGRAKDGERLRTTNHFRRRHES